MWPPSPPGSPWQTSQSRSPSSDPVVVRQVRTCCRRAPGVVSRGTRTPRQRRLADVQRGDLLQQGNGLLSDLLHGDAPSAASRFQGGCPQESKGSSETESSAHGQQCSTPATGSQRP